MTREEQIKKGAIDRIHGIFKCNGKYPCSALRYCRFGTGENNAYNANECGADDYESGFIDGVRYADDNPVNPWHDASIELPKVDERHKYVLVVVARPDNRVHFACYSHAGFFVNESFYGEFEINDVKYWMEIPELPKEL